MKYFIHQEGKQHEISVEEFDAARDVQKSMFGRFFVYQRNEEIHLLDTRYIRIGMTHNCLPEKGDYRLKRDEVLANFHEHFLKHEAQYDPMFRQILEMLTRDASPYDMIELLIKERIKAAKQMETIIAVNGMPPVI